MSTANTLFVMIASILVFLMTPGLAFFYGGLVSSRNIVNTFMSVFSSVVYLSCFGSQLAGPFHSAVMAPLLATYTN